MYSKAPTTSNKTKFMKKGQHTFNTFVYVKILRLSLDVLSRKEIENRCFYQITAQVETSQCY